MFTSTKLSEIKRELAKALTRNGKQLADWLARERRGRRSGPSPDQTVLEDLQWMQKMLREAVEAKKSRGRKSTKARSKKTPAG